MATYTKGLDLYKDQLARLQRTKAGARHGHRMVAEEMERDVRRLLSGNLTRKQTRGAFARGASAALSTPTGRRRQLTPQQRKIRALRGAVPLNPVNVQSGRLRRGSRKREVAKGLQAFDLVIAGVPYAQYVLAVGGTRKAVDRQVQKELKRVFGPRNKALIDHLRALQTT